jgi:hypothetical protein
MKLYHFDSNIQCTKYSGPLELHTLNLVEDRTFSYLQITSEEFVTTIIMNMVALKDLEI